MPARRRKKASSAQATSGLKAAALRVDPSIVTAVNWKQLARSAGERLRAAHRRRRKRSSIRLPSLPNPQPAIDLRRQLNNSGFTNAFQQLPPFVPSQTIIHFLAAVTLDDAAFTAWCNKRRAVPSIPHRAASSSTHPVVRPDGDNATRCS